MVVAQEKYLFPEPPGLEAPETEERIRSRNRRQRRVNRRARLQLGVMAVGALFLLGIAVVVAYVYPTQLGYRQVSLEKELAQLEKENQQLELAIARSRSLERIEAIAVTRLNMTRPENGGVMVAAKPSPPASTAGAATAGSPVVQAVMRMAANTQGLASRGKTTGAPADD